MWEKPYGDGACPLYWTKAKHAAVNQGDEDPPGVIQRESPPGRLGRKDITPAHGARVAGKGGHRILGRGFRRLGSVGSQLARGDNGIGAQR